MTAPSTEGYWVEEALQSLPLSCDQITLARDDVQETEAAASVTSSAFATSGASHRTTAPPGVNLIPSPLSETGESRLVTLLDRVLLGLNALQYKPLGTARDQLVLAFRLQKAGFHNEAKKKFKEAISNAEQAWNSGLPLAGLIEAVEIMCTAALFRFSGDIKVARHTCAEYIERLHREPHVVEMFHSTDWAGGVGGGGIRSYLTSDNRELVRKICRVNLAIYRFLTAQSQAVNMDDWFDIKSEGRDPINPLRFAFHRRVCGEPELFNMAGVQDVGAVTRATDQENCIFAITRDGSRVVRVTPRYYCHFLDGIDQKDPKLTCCVLDHNDPMLFGVGCTLWEVTMDTSRARENHVTIPCRGGTIIGAQRLNRNGMLVLTSTGEIGKISLDDRFAVTDVTWVKLEVHADMLPLNPDVASVIGGHVVVVHANMFMWRSVRRADASKTSLHPDRCLPGIHKYNALTGERALTSTDDDLYKKGHTMRLRASKDNCLVVEITYDNDTTNKTIRILRLQSLEVIVEMTPAFGILGSVFSVATSDDDYVAILNGRTLSIWEFETGKQLLCDQYRRGDDPTPVCLNWAGPKHLVIACHAPPTDDLVQLRQICV